LSDSNNFHCQNREVFLHKACKLFLIAVVDTSHVLLSIVEHTFSTGDDTETINRIRIAYLVNMDIWVMNVGLFDVFANR